MVISEGDNINLRLDRDSLYLIFSHLPFLDKIRAQRVCKVWKHLLENLVSVQPIITIKGNLWKSICDDTDHVHRREDNLARIFQKDDISKVIIQHDILIDILRRCSNVKVVQLIDVTIEGDETLATIAQLCPGIECLNLFFVETVDKSTTLDTGLRWIAWASNSRLKHLYLKAMNKKFGENTLRDVFRMCPNLQIVNVENSIITLSDSSLCHLTSNMTKFSGAFCAADPFDQDGHNQFIQGFQESGLLAICQGFGQHLSELRLSSISDAVLYNICKNLLNLKCLELFWEDQDPVPHNCYQISSLRNLQRLTLRVKNENVDFFDEDVLQIMKSCPKLKTLVLSVPLGDSSMQHIATFCPNIEQLGLMFAKNPKLVSDKSFKAFAALRNLRVLDVWDSAVTDEACIALIKACPKLTFLSLRSCHEISNSSFYAYLKKAHNQQNLKMKFCHYQTRIVLRPHDLKIIPDNLKVKGIHKAPFW
ncbi:uncharacterized protein LOC141849505 [Brevipalpus obovatus]|uniref:uncharacterized protein LOC141849505 n=1 Tax=Brevipalpus obovatus TaxID=246614 RepID=UPI003D9F95E2